MKYPLLMKALVLGCVIVVLNVGLSLVDGLVVERRDRQREAEAAVADSLAGRQTLLGPVLQRSCVETWEAVEGEGKDRKTVVHAREFAVISAPAALKVTGDSTLEPRYRGLFKVNAYVSHAKIEATWDSRADLVGTAQQPKGQLKCEQPRAIVTVSDPRGVRAVSLRIDGAITAASPQALDRSSARGFGAMVPEGTGPLRVDLDLELAGTRSIAWVPIGNDTTVSWASPWPHPSFGGRFLPTDRSIGSDGFSAQWKVSSLATTAQRMLKQQGTVCSYVDDGLQVGGSPCIDGFGVSFIDPVDRYVLSDRAVKYGLLFIVLTLGGVALTEVLRRVRVHPVQYLLVGAALTIFFLLLLSLSEHLSFDVSYLVASGACTALLTFYGGYVLRGVRAALGLGASVAALYAALYTLLKMEQASLVVGSLLLFGVLAGVMIMTRKVDWYSVASVGSPSAARA
ncbi:cell envelope integrity protein CreD [soil metagenome]